MPQDGWHDAKGEPKATPERVRAFVEDGVVILNTAGPQLAALARQVNSKTANYDYLALIKGLFVSRHYHS
jgi:hypothetical protein